MRSTSQNPRIDTYNQKRLVTLIWEFLSLKNKDPATYSKPARCSFMNRKCWMVYMKVTQDYNKIMGGAWLDFCLEPVQNEAVRRLLPSTSLECAPWASASTPDTSLSRATARRLCHQLDGISGTTLLALLNVNSASAKHPLSYTITLRMTHFFSPLLYVMDFGTIAKESLKRLSKWAAKDFIHPASCYPVPQTGMLLGDIKFR